MPSVCHSYVHWYSPHTYWETKAQKSQEHDGNSQLASGRSKTQVCLALVFQLPNSEILKGPAVWYGDFDDLSPGFWPGSSGRVRLGPQCWQDFSFPTLFLGATKDFLATTMSLVSWCHTSMLLLLVLSIWSALVSSFTMYNPFYFMKNSGSSFKWNQFQDQPLTSWATIRQINELLWASVSSSVKWGQLLK